ncbi:MAG: hypothetical protein ACRYG4_16925 [Janthinobacterium lividum]
MTAPYRLLAWSERARWWTAQVQRGVPALVTLVLIVTMTVPVFAGAPALPHLGLLGVFVWTTFQPGLMPPWCAFVLGGAADLLLGLPLGVNATLLPATSLFVRLFEARFGHHRYGFDWVLLAVVATVFELLTWRLLAFSGTHGPFAPLLIQVAATVVAYPAVVLLCAGIQLRMQPAPCSARRPRASSNSPDWRSSSAARWARSG